MNGALRLSALFALFKTVLTLLIPEAARRSLDDLCPEDVVSSAEAIVATSEPHGAVPVTEGAPAPASTATG